MEKKRSWKLKNWPKHYELSKGEGSDVILIGPQVRYALKKVQAAYPNTPVSDIDMRTYGLMDGAGVIKIAEKLMQ